MKTDAITQDVAGKLPISPLSALALAGFITILTEALPAGMLPQIGQSLAISSALAGQLVSVYALGSLLAAIPLTLATQSLRRRPLLLCGIAGFVLANTVTAFSTSYLLTLAARFIAGVSAGLLGIDRRLCRPYGAGCPQRAGYRAGDGWHTACSVSGDPTGKLAK